MERVTSADGTTLVAHVSGSGPALVMIDPAGGFSGMRPMAEAAERLACQMTVATYDRRGRGESGDSQPYAVQREVEDIAAIIDHVGQPATLYGFSSGAALALHAASGDVGVERVILFEPAVDLDQDSDPGFTAELEQLIDDGQRGDAIEFFNRGIGVPEELVAGLRAHPAWPGLEALAHTLVYDLAVSDSTTRALLAAVTVPVTVLASDGSDPTFQQWARDVSNAVPNGRFELIAGEWHGASADALATAILGAADHGEARS